MNKRSFEKHFHFVIFPLFSRMMSLQKKIRWKWRKQQMVVRPEKQANEWPSKILLPKEIMYRPLILRMRQGNAWLSEFWSRSLLKKQKSLSAHIFFISSFRSKTVSEPPPIAEAAVLSPVPSPADPVPRALKRIKGAEAPTSSTNLRRKRILDAAFPKPVTRRKKL